MNENYIMLNGKRVDLTDEQIEKLGLKVKKEDCFTEKLNYYYIDDCGDVEYQKICLFVSIDEGRYKVANYCTDKSLLQQRAYHEILSRLLWRFSMQNDGDKINWENKYKEKYRIYMNIIDHRFDIKTAYHCKFNDIYFISYEIAQRAIDEIVLPFMKEHPDFIW